MAIGHGVGGADEVPISDCLVSFVKEPNLCSGENVAKQQSLYQLHLQHGWPNNVNDVISTVLCRDR